MSKTGPHSLDSFRSSVDLNLIGTFNISRLAAWQMSKNEPEDEERGVIINTASIAAFEGQIGQVAYTASKAAIAGMCLTMARDLGSLGIRVLAIAPSLFATGLTEGIPDEFAKQLTKDAAFPKRLGRPEEYAKLVARDRGEPDAQRPVHPPGCGPALRPQVGRFRRDGSRSARPITPKSQGGSLSRRARHGGQRPLTDPGRDGAANIGRTGHRDAAVEQCVRPTHVPAPDAGQRAQAGLRRCLPARNPDRSRRHRPRRRPPPTTSATPSAPPRRVGTPAWCATGARRRWGLSGGCPTSAGAGRDPARRVRRSSAHPTSPARRRPSASSCPHCVSE